MPPAFNLSQDQTLQFKFDVATSATILRLDRSLTRINTRSSPSKLDGDTTSRRKRPHKSLDRLSKLKNGLGLTPTEGARLYTDDTARQ